MKKNPNIVPEGLSIQSLTLRLFHDPDNVGLQHRLMEARLERSMELGLIVSPEDAEVLYSYTWSLKANGYPQANMDAPAEFCTAAAGTKYCTTLNRLVLARMLGCQPWEISNGIHADHINEDLGVLNCTRDNIQALSISDNIKKGKDRKAKLNLVYAMLFDLPDGEVA